MPEEEFKSVSLLAGATKDEALGWEGFCHGAAAAVVVGGVAGDLSRFCNLLL